MQSSQIGGKAIAHSPQCRARIEEEMRKDESQRSKLERTDKRMVKTIVGRDEKSRRTGDAVDEKKTDASNDNKSEGSKMDISALGSQQAQVPDMEILKHDDNEETSERPNKKVRFEDEQMEVDSGHDVDTKDKMLCQIETMPNSAESEDLDRLHGAI